MAGPYCRDGDKQIRSGDKVFRFRGYQLSQPAPNLAGAFCMHTDNASKHYWQSVGATT